MIDRMLKSIIKGLGVTLLCSFISTSHAYADMGPSKGRQELVEALKSVKSGRFQDASVKLFQLSHN